MISDEEIASSVDLQQLRDGGDMIKIVKKKKKVRFYKFDFKKNKLVASSRELMNKEKLYSFLKFSEVKCGTTIDQSREFEPNDIDLAFTIYYNDFHETLTLVAADEAQRTRWIDTINYLIQKKMNPSNEKLRIRAGIFELHDSDGSNELKKKEIKALLQSLNFDHNDMKISKLIKKADMDGDRKLDKEELEVFLNNLYHRSEIEDIYKRLTNGAETMQLMQFKNFIQHIQCEDLTESECSALICEYENQETLSCKNEISLFGFINYLNDDSQYLCKPSHKETYMDMSLPVCNYYINSSHNTYLSGDQLTSQSKADCYRIAMMKGARFVELDIYDGPDNCPIITHGNTMTSKIIFEDVLIICRDHGFECSEYPLILTLEMHCKEQLGVVASLIMLHLGPFLYEEEIVEGEYPSPEMLKGKVIIRAKKADDSLLTEEDIEQIINKPPGFNNLVQVMQNAKFKGIDYGFENYKQFQTSSLSEVVGKKLLEEETGPRIINYTNNFMVKVYPAYYRQDSSNLNALDYWNYGFQKVALNFQTLDTSMQLNTALFADNGNCGYVLKPEVFKDPEFDPSDISTMKNKKMLHLKIISGQRFPGKSPDSFVRAEIFGVHADMDQEFKTKSVKDNGFDPQWNEEMEFNVNCPELAFLKLTVVDKDFGRDDTIGYNVIRFNSLRNGYRHLNLVNSKSKGSLFVYVNIESIDASTF